MINRLENAAQEKRKNSGRRLIGSYTTHKTVVPVLTRGQRRRTSGRLTLTVKQFDNPVNNIPNPSRTDDAKVYRAYSWRPVAR